MSFSKRTIKHAADAAKAKMNEYVIPQCVHSQRTGYYLALLDVIEYMRTGVVPPRWLELVGNGRT